MRSTKSPSWTKRLLGLAPVAVPPHVFEVNSERLRFASFPRTNGGWQMGELAEVELPDNAFQSGPLGGPLRTPEVFERVLSELLEQVGEPVSRASLVVPDRWLRLLFTELEEAPGEITDEVFRFKLRKLVPFKVEDLRVGGLELEALPARPGKGRALMAFAVEQLLAEIENAFEARGIRIGQIASRTLYLSSYLSDDYEDSLIALVEGDDYSLLFMSEGVPVLVRYRTFPLAADDTASAEHVARDLRLIRSYLTENLPDRRFSDGLVCGPAETASAWVELLEEGFGLKARVLGESDADLGSAPPGMPWHQLLPLFAAATQEVL